LLAAGFFSLPAEAALRAAAAGFSLAAAFSFFSPRLKVRFVDPSFGFRA
jgi:hypothetical protein